MSNPSLKEVCKAVGIGWLELAKRTGQPPTTMKKRYLKGHVPRHAEAETIIRVLLLENRRVKALHPSVIRNLWRSAA